MIPIAEKKPAKVMINNWRDDESVKNRINAVLESERKNNAGITYGAVASYIMKKGLEAVENE